MNNPRKEKSLLVAGGLALLMFSLVLTPTASASSDLTQQDTDSMKVCVPNTTICQYHICITFTNVCIFCNPGDVPPACND